MENFNPPEGKALIYFVRPASIGFLIKFKVFIDENLIGFTKGKNYLYAILEPGKHKILTKSENTSKLELEVEAGKTYFIKQKVGIGFFIARNKMRLVNEIDGKLAFNKCRPAKTLLDEGVEDEGIKGRPVVITIICVLGFIGFAVSVPQSFIGWGANIVIWYKIYVVLSSLLGLVCFIGMWKMKKWGAYGYSGLFVLGQIVMILAGYWHPVAIIFPGIITGVALYFSKSMT